jgi:diguanylate cyclase (GGDEF)-like protein
MPRWARSEASSGYTILLVDDNADYLQATRLLLERDGHEVITATNGAEALALLPHHRVDLLLLDYFMPGMTGEQVVAQIRKFDPYVQIVLQTGYASEQPPRELLRRLDIQGYYDKTEGPEQLLMWTSVGLKSANTIKLLYRSRDGLRRILSATPELHKLESLDVLLPDVLAQIATLVPALQAPAVDPAGGTSPGSETIEGFLAVLEANAELVIRARTARWSEEAGVQTLASVRRALEQGEVVVGRDGTALPLRVGPVTVGVVFLQMPAVGDQVLELLRVFANQAAVAIHNAQLYEMATVDLLTGVHVRSFGDQHLARAIRTAFRTRQPVGVVRVDVDGLARINEAAGRLAGDGALSLIGRMLRDVTRAGDVVARYGGDEFVVVAGQASAPGAERMALRIIELLKGHVIAGHDGEIPLGVSIGIGMLPPHDFPPESVARPIAASYFEAVASSLLASALSGLDEARRAGGTSVRAVPGVAWPQPA